MMPVQTRLTAAGERERHDTTIRGEPTVTDLPVPTARRLQPPRWRDPRLFVGLLLVLLSVTLGALVVAHADDRVPVYAARVALVPGQPVSPDDLRRVDVQLGGQQDHYLAAGVVASDRFVLRPVEAGELVPSTAVGGRDDVGVQPLTLGVDAGSAAALRVGARVDVYVNPVDPQDGGSRDRFRGPELALHGVSVSSLPRGGDGFGSGTVGDRPVQVMAPTNLVKGIIGQVDEGARVTMVPVPGAALRVER
jgi:hypothetical protein